MKFCKIALAALLLGGSVSVAVNATAQQLAVKTVSDKEDMKQTIQHYERLLKVKNADANELNQVAERAQGIISHAMAGSKAKMAESGNMQGVESKQYNALVEQFNALVSAQNEGSRNGVLAAMKAALSLL
ncbi:MAG TPA: hypothetical protein VKZ76_04500 [Edaphocola sp.]|nr:hypothetical protein [Edaphocola sp.]